MGSLERRLQALEGSYAAREAPERGISSKEVLARMSVDEKRSYVWALRRARDTREFAEEDRPILERVGTLREEVTDEQKA
jgi:hypothetical protein